MGTLFFLLLIFVCYIGVLIRWKSLGANFSKNYVEDMQHSFQFDASKQRFFNKKQSLIASSKAKIKFSVFFYKFLFQGKLRKPEKRFSEEKPNWDDFLSASSKFKFIWVGHSTILVNLNGTILLFDPVFSKLIGPLRFFFYYRFQMSPISLKELPKIDYIVLSHDHYDHLDMHSILYFRKKETKFIAPLGISRHLEHWGIQKERIYSLDWWNELEVASLKFICTPAQHFSGRRMRTTLKTLWCSWVVKNQEHSLYFSGDSGYGPHFAEIGKKLGPFDIAFVETGQYNKMWPLVHMFPHESAQAFIDLKGRKYVPIHWGTFDLGLHVWHEPIEEIDYLSAQKNILLLAPKLGQVVDVESSNAEEKWWKEFITRG